MATAAPADACAHCGAPLRSERRAPRVGVVGYGVGVPGKPEHSHLRRDTAFTGFDFGGWVRRLAWLIALAAIAAFGYRACQPDYRDGVPRQGVMDGLREEVETGRSDRESAGQERIPEATKPVSEPRTEPAPSSPRPPSSPPPPRNPHRFNDPQTFKRMGNDALQGGSDRLRQRAGQ